jgi:homoaconitase/3-isopropylmalate dehydratase large subunit
VSAKDLMLYLIGRLGADGCGYKSAEFYGDALPRMSISERMTMANLAMEMGSKCVFVPPDEKTAEYLRPRLKDPATQYQPVYADADAVYEQEIRVDLSQLEPMVACPHQVENTKPVTEVAGTRIDQAFLGSCANGKYEDLAVAAQILRGRKVAPRVRLIVTPGSRQILLEAMQSGVLQTLVESGALVTNPGCGACAGDGGTMADGEVSLSTANRNFIGRMGSPKSSIYLSSPATLAASALRGAIADPREFL